MKLMNNHSRKILIAEDEAINRLYIKIILERNGFEIIEARDGIEVIERFREQVPDLVLLDISMPRMSGVDAAREIRKLEGDTDSPVPIIALTAHTMPKRIEQFLEAGMNAVVEKPVDDAMLLKSLNEHLKDGPSGNSDTE